MNKYLKITISMIVILSSYHLLRDLLQIAGVDNAFINVFHRPHVWCGKYCGVVTLPLELLELIGGVIVLKRNSFGTLGVVILSTLPLWLVALLLP